MCKIKGVAKTGIWMIRTPVSIDNGNDNDDKDDKDDDDDNDDNHDKDENDSNDYIIMAKMMVLTIFKQRRCRCWFQNGADTQTSKPKLEYNDDQNEIGNGNDDKDQSQDYAGTININIEILCQFVSQ